MSPDPTGVAAPRDPTGDAPAEPAEPAEPATPRYRTEPEAPARVTAPTPRAGANRKRLLDDPDPDDEAPRERSPKRQKVRARKVRRIVRHIEPWSVLKISLLFFLSLFLIICVASALLWNTARSAGAIDDVEGFITSLGFGNCEDVEGADPDPESPTASTVDGAAEQLAPSGTAPTETTVAVEPEEESTLPDEDGECREGQVLVGGFKFEDERIFQSFVLGGIVLVLSGAAFSVVMALLFNLISDLTGGVRVTVLHDEPAGARRRPTAEGAADREPLG